ncbi:MAG: hypothetical protein MJ051_07960 [Akkermansia sp.]|nr:hypothetical protein [Akkermansia sp.]
MKSAFSLCLVAALPLCAQQAVDVSAFPVVTLEGWGRLMLPVPPGYEAICFKGEDHFLFSLAKPKEKAALEIYNGYAPAVSEDGERCYTEIAGKRRKGVSIPQEDGGTVHEFLLSETPAGSSYLVSLPSGPDTGLMTAVLAAMRLLDTQTAAPTTSLREQPSDAPDELRTFRCKGAFSLTVPADLRVVENKTADDYQFHFMTPKGDLALYIYCGYAPTIQTGGESCTAVIAGNRTEGNKLTGTAEPSSAVGGSAPKKMPTRGEEYVLPGGAEGALYHIIIPEGPYQPRLTAALAAMQMSGGSPLPAAAQEQSAALRESAEACVRNANIILAKVKDRASADAAVAELQPLADTMQANDKAAAALQKRYGRALHAYLHAPDKPDSELSPTTPTRKTEPENEIQRVHGEDCYGSEALDNLLMRFMGIEND